MRIQPTNHNPTIGDMNEIRENTMMTHNDQAKARFPLSLDGRGARGEGVLLILSSLLFALLSAAPAAWADNECGVDDPTLNGPLADSYDCPDPDYPEGVTYAADGDLTVNFTNGGVTTIGENPDNGGDDPEPGDDLTDRGGIDLSATGSDSIVFDGATTGTEIESNGVLGALLSVTTVDGSIDIDTAQMDADESAAGVTHAIFAESTGSGSIDITTTANVDAQGGSTPADSIGIEAITNTGNINLTVASGQIQGNQYGIWVETGTSAEATVNNAGTIGSAASSNTGTAIRATGGAFTFNNDGTLDGLVDFSGLEGGYVFNNNADGFWRVRGTDQVANLGAGEFNNAGTIDLRGPILVTDIGSADSKVVSAPGSTFTGIGDSTLDMRVFLTGTGQNGCANVNVASCMDLQGGATAGQTSILVRGRFTTLVTDTLTTVTTANPGIVLVDVGGGTSDASHFTLHPNSQLVQADGAGSTTTAAYATDPVYGAVLDTSVLGMGGIFDYTLLYNPDTQQHLLASVPQSEAIEYVSFIRQAASIWHTTTDTVVGRQAALRDGATGKLWARYVNDSSEYDPSPSFTTQGNTFNYDQQYSTDTTALVIGLDLISGNDRVFGVHGGLVSADSQFDTGTNDESKGIAAGLYGGWWHDSGLSVDGAVNLTSLTVDHSLSTDALESGDSDVRSLGARVEAGWRLPLLEKTLYVQPLATAAYVVGDFDDVDLRDNEVSFEGTESSRTSLGARVGGTVGMADSGRFESLEYWLTARAWEEYADEGEARFATRDGGYLAIADDRSGSFEEVDLGFDLSGGNLNVHFAAGMQFGDDIESSRRFSIGARLNW